MSSQKTGELFFLSSCWATLDFFQIRILVYLSKRGTRYQSNANFCIKIRVRYNDKIWVWHRCMLQHDPNYFHIVRKVSKEKNGKLMQYVQFVYYYHNIVIWVWRICIKYLKFTIIKVLTLINLFYPITYVI